MLHSGLKGRILLIALCQLFKIPVLTSLLLYKLYATKNKEIMIVLANTLGDSIYGLSCLEELKKKYSGYKVKVACSPKWKKVVETYTGIDEIISWGNSRFVKLIVETLETSQFLSAVACKCNVFGYVFGFRRGLKAEDIREIHELRERYDLPKDGIITYHGAPIEDKITAIVNFKEKKEKIVVVNPYSSTSAEIDYILFDQIVRELKERSYEVYTNAYGTAKALPGTKKLNCSIQEFFNIAKEIPLIVSQRSGILDYIITSGVNLFVICPTTSNGLDRRLLTKRFTLTEWETGGILSEQVLRIGNAEDHKQIIDNFINYLDELESE